MKQQHHHPAPAEPAGSARTAPLAVTVAQFLSLVPIGRTKCHEMMKAGTLKSFTIGRRRLILMESVSDLLASIGGSGVSHDAE